MYSIDKASYDLINKAPVLPNSDGETTNKGVLAQIYTDSTEADFKYMLNQIKKENPESLEYNLVEI